MAIREYIVKVTNDVIPDGFERFEDEWSPEELVRCWDCKNYEGEGHYCHTRGLGRPLKPDDYCCDGRRKKDD